jgi:hypothetical protein
MNVNDTFVYEIKPDYDIGRFLNTNIQDNLFKYQLLMTPWIPNLKYNFKAAITHGKRPFLHEWLKNYDWLCYSSVLKSALCNYIVYYLNIQLKEVV